MLRVMASEGGSGTAAFLSVFDSGRRAAGQPLGLALQNSTSDPGMSMKTKNSVKKSWAGADVAFERLRCAEGAVWSDCAACPALSLRDIADPHIGVCGSLNGVAGG